MKKIGVITFHKAHSYGAQLQAYATVEFLNNQGYVAEIIDYVNSYEQRFQKIFRSDNGKWTGYIINFVKEIILLKKYFAKKAFSQSDKHIPISAKKYTSLADLDTVDYDVVVAGSDQIWNPQITDGIDKAFLLQFGNNVKRISIASSFGSYLLSTEEQAVYRSAFEKFDAISTREIFGKEQIERLTSKPVKLLMDPTFLLDREQWETQLAAKSKYSTLQDKYIVTFFVAPQPSYKEKVRRYAEAMRLPVWSIQPTIVKRVDCDKLILGANINDFVALLQNAALVITDSFHGVALSLNLNKNFISFNNAGNPVRISSLLNLLGLNERLDMPPEEFKAIDYKAIGKKLEAMREDSKGWILNEIGEQI